MPITTLPSPPNTSDPSSFSAKADALISALPNFVSEANSLEVNVNAKSAAADAAAAAASVASNAIAWISGTTYAIGDVRWSLINFRSYRRKTAGAGTTDPSSDSTNWADLSGSVSIGAVGSTGITQSTAKMLGRTTAGTGSIEEIAIGDGLTLSAGTLTSTGVPAGTIIDFAGSSAPTGYLICNGASLLRAGTYANLFTAIGVLWGSVDGTHFNVPNFASGEAAVQNAGTVGASTVGEVISHFHESTSGNVPAFGDGTTTASMGNFSSANSQVADKTSAVGGTKNKAAGQYVLKCIKY